MTLKNATSTLFLDLPRGSADLTIVFYCEKDYGLKDVWDFMSETGLRLESNPEL